MIGESLAHGHTAVLAHGLVELVAASPNLDGKLGRRVRLPVPDWADVEIGRCLGHMLAVGRSPGAAPSMASTLSPNRSRRFVLWPSSRIPYASVSSGHDDTEVDVVHATGLL